jgi:thiol-disulfide isomerase/thioredoxin
MIRYLILLFIFIAGSSFSNEAEAEGYELKVRIKNLANKEIILGHHFADKLYPDDTLKLDNSGIGILKGKTKYPEGIYFFLTPSRKLFDFFLTGNQRFSIETDTLDLFEKLKFEYSPENSAALDYSRFITEKQKETNAILEQKKKLTDANELKKNTDQIDQISKEVKAKSDKVISAQKDNFVGQFLKATQEITLPDPPKNSDGKILDSTFQYRYYRNHFFDNINLTDARFLRSPVYDDKIKTYIEKVIPQIPDTITLECDKLLEIAEKDKDIFRYMLVTLFNYYASSTIMGFDAVYVHIAEKWYIPKSTFGDTAFIRKTQENIVKLKPLLLGKTTPNLRMLWVPTEHFLQAKTDSIAKNNPHSGSFIDINHINAKYTILAFWESDCSHCKKIIPELYEVYERLKPKGVEVMAIHMLGGVEGKQKWIKFVNEHEMYDWLNVWNPYDFTYKKTYDISLTPVIFVLDKDKKIIGKRLEPKQIEEFLNALIKQEEKKK